MKLMVSDAKVRVRFAPSPTGQLHIGNVRTALFNWLFARQKGGTFILRIEDTDLERSEARYETQLLDDLKWLGIDWDEGPDIGGPFPPYRQSDKMGVYQAYAEKLIADNKAYYCFCTAEELERERERALAEQRQPVYSGKCRRLDSSEAHRRRAAGEPAAIRIKMPDHAIRFHDIVRGTVEFASEIVGDQIIVRSNGMPIYNYVVVIDDADMQITHVIRGDDHISNTPKQVAVYEALGLQTPEFAHLSTILGPDGQRLSKRHGATSVANFRDMGVLPEALMNYLALLGWAPSGGDREIFPKDDLIKEFSLERVTPSPAVFDMAKLYWLNRHYIKQCPPERLHELGRGFLQRAGLLPEHLDDATQAWADQLIGLLAPYVDKLDELPERAAIIFRHEPAAALANTENASAFANSKSGEVIAEFARRTAADSPLTPERFKAVMNEIKVDLGVKGKDLFHPVRIALIGAHSGPDFDRLIPIIENGSRLPLSAKVKSVRERVTDFGAALD
ncbi:MAG TPA: glutamate--tRNA ligase [Candidatus Angelobacter sp.]|jgi:glutamyl-tRNA synthetase/nondiscriminating glutamyl-tRNA synthetase|nr:glutamate--tRNA ligase [Candidatus Angelobacter sp.]